MSKNRMFRDARAALGVQTAREGLGAAAKYVLSLPKSSLVPMGIMDAPSETRPPMENVTATKARLPSGTMAADTASAAA